MDNSLGTSKKFFLLALLAPILWGTTYMVTSVFLPIDKPFFIALMRALPAGLLLLLAKPKLPKGIWIFRSALLGFLNIGGFFACLFFASYRISGGVLSVLGTLNTLFVVLISYVFLSEKPSLKTLMACLLTLFGVVLLVAGPKVHLDLYGLAASLLGTFLMSVGLILTKRWGRPVENLTFTAWQLIFGSLVLLPIALIYEGVPLQLTGANWLGIFWLTVINTALAYSLWFFAIERLTASQMTFLGAMSPVTALLLGYVFLGQTLSLIQLLGIFMVFLAIFLSQSKD